LPMPGAGAPKDRFPGARSSVSWTLITRAVRVRDGIGASPLATRRRFSHTTAASRRKDERRENDRCRAMGFGVTRGRIAAVERAKEEPAMQSQFRRRRVMCSAETSDLAAPTPTTGSINRSIPIRNEVSITWSSSSSSAVARRQRPTVRTASSSTHDSISFTARRARKSVVYLCDSGPAVWNSLPSDLCMTTLTLIHSKTSQSALLVLLIGDSCTALANVE